MNNYYLDNIHSIRKEIRKIQAETHKDAILFNSVKRIFIATPKSFIKAANDSTITRDQYPSEKTKEKPTVQMSALENMSKMLNDRHERQQLAEHILFLLKNNFANEDGAVIRKLTDLSQQLVDETSKLAIGADAVLNDQGNKLAPQDFKRDIVDITQDLAGQLDLSTKDINIKYYAGVDKIQQDNEIVDRLYNMAYLEVKNFKGSDMVQDLYIVATRRVNPQGGHSDFIRTFHNYVNPTALMKNNIGTEYKNTNRAAEIVMRSLKMDKIIDAIHPSQIPVKKELINIKHNNIDRQKINEAAGNIQIFLDSGVQSKAEADKILQEVFLQMKNIVKSVYPRNRNILKVSDPKLTTVRYKKKGSEKETTKKQYVFRIQFSKPEDKDSLELPRDKIAQFMKVLDINSASAAAEFNKLLKRYIGTKP